MRKCSPWLWLSFVLSVGLLACSKQPVNQQPVIAVIPKGTLHEFWKAIHAGADQAAKANAVAIQWNGPQPEGDRQAQIHLVQNFISAGVQGIVLAPIDERALQPVVAEAKAAGIPTVVIDSALLGDAHVSYIATDNRKGGELGGDHLAKLLGGKGKVILLRFQQGSARARLLGRDGAQSWHHHRESGAVCGRYREGAAGRRVAPDRAPRCGWCVLSQ
jgi:ABC-type sugar transport system substrate-binding protein